MLKRLLGIFLTAACLLAPVSGWTATNGQWIDFGPFFSGGTLQGSVKVYHYSAGTTTLKDCYSDRAKTTTVAQPFVLDAQGYGSMFCDGLYKFTVKDSADATLYTLDNVAVVDNSLTTVGEGSAITSASTLTLPGDGDYHHVTGSTGPITAISGTQGRVTLTFDSTPTLTHSGNLILMGSVNHVAAAGDVLTFVNDGSGVWREESRRLYVPETVRQDFRCSLTTAVPVTTSDVTAAETLYVVPYVGNHIGLYDGARWVDRASAEMSIDVPDVTQVHDVFIYDNAGTPTLEVLAWTNDTTRATALAYQNGIYVKSGATTRRYLCSFYSTTAGNGQIEDSVAKRNLWNYYNRVSRHMQVVEATNSWTYTTATWRQANAAATNQLELVVGVIEEAVEVVVQATVSNATEQAKVAVGVGVDSTSTNSAQLMGAGLIGQDTVTTFSFTSAQYRGILAAGRHTLVWLEISEATGTTTWYGDNGITYWSSGLVGTVRG